MNEEYFMQIFNIYNKDIYRFSYSYLRDSDLSIDAVQETFLRFYNNPPKKSDSTKFWLFKVCKNVCKDILKNNRKPINNLANEAIDKTGMKEDNIIQLVNELPNKYSYMVRLYYYGNCSSEYISNRLEIDKATVRKRLERARKMLKDRLEEK